MPTSVPSWEEFVSLRERVDALEGKCVYVEDLVPGDPGPGLPPPPPPVVTPVPVDPPTPGQGAVLTGANFWVGGPPKSIDGAIPGKWWFMGLDDRENVAHYRDNWGINHFRLNYHPQSTGDTEPLAAVLKAIIAENCIPLIDIHAPTGSTPDIDMVKSLWNSEIWPAIQSVGQHADKVQFSPANEPYRHGQPDVRSEWLIFHRKAFWEARTDGFKGVLVANAPWWGQDRDGATMPIEKSCLLNEGATLVSEFGGRGEVGLDVHTYSYWDPMWRDDNPVTVDYMVEYFVELVKITNWPIIGEYGGPIPPELAETSAALGWSNQTIALPDYGAALKLGQAMKDQRFPETVSHHVWHASRMTSQLHYNQSPIPTTNAPNNGWLGKVTGTGSGEPFRMDDVSLTPIGEVHARRLGNMEQHWEDYVNLPAVNWH